MSRALANTVALALYVAFAAIVYVIHGPEPALSIDHISYFKLADEIRAGFPEGDYWRSINSVRAYGVMLAYLYDYTGSHITSLKILLAILTVMYLAAFQVYMGLATQSRVERVMFALLSALFVSFGASIWGMTDFAASLNRTLVIPFVVLVAWFFFRYFHTPWRYAAFPTLVVLSLLHLSALHVILVFSVFEVLDFVFRRRFRIDRDIAYLIVAFLACVAIQWGIERAGAGTASFVRHTVNVVVAPVVSSPEETRPVPPPASLAEKPKAAPVPPPKKPPDKLTPKEAWEVELFAFPWRNLPPTFATLATIAASYGVIFLLALAGVLLAFRKGPTRSLDRLMLMFAASVLFAAYGLQTLLWILRNLMSVLPFNFEEIRAVNMLMLPSVYFVYRLYELVPSIGRAPRRAIRVAIVLAFVLQPIVIVRASPASWREGIVDAAIAKGWIKRSDTPRVIYARQFLGLSGDGRRFYYSALPAMQWLKRHTQPNDVVLTNINEFYSTQVKTTGAFLNVVTMDVWDLRRESWAASLDAVDRALATGDTEQVRRIARKYGATYAVVTWPVDGAVYQDGFYTIIRVK